MKQSCYLKACLFNFCQIIIIIIKDKEEGRKTPDKIQGKGRYGKKKYRGGKA